MSSSILCRNVFYQGTQVSLAMSSTSTTLVSHTNSHADRGRPTLKDVERFRNGPFRRLTKEIANVVRVAKVTNDQSLLVQMNQIQMINSNVDSAQYYIAMHCKSTNLKPEVPKEDDKLVANEGRELMNAMLKSQEAERACTRYKLKQPVFMDYCCYRDKSQAKAEVFNPYEQSTRQKKTNVPRSKVRMKSGEKSMTWSKNRTQQKKQQWPSR